MDAEIYNQLVSAMEGVDEKMIDEVTSIFDDVYQDGRDDGYQDGIDEGYSIGHFDAERESHKVNPDDFYKRMLEAILKSNEGSRVLASLLEDRDFWIYSEFQDREYIRALLR